MGTLPDFNPITLQQAFKSLYHSMLLWGLVTLIVLDIITGILVATSNGKLDSKIGLKGLIKHTTIIILVVLMGVVSRLINVQWVSQSFCMFYILQYIFSLLESLNAMGIPFPDWLSNMFNRMGKDYNEGNFKNDKI